MADSSVIPILMNIVLLATLPYTSQTDAGKESLQGLPGVAVRVESVSPDVARYGLTEASLEKRVTDGLRAASVATLEPSDARSSDRMPFVIVRLQTVAASKSAFAWHLETAVHQGVAGLEGAPPRMLALTWAASSKLGVSTTTVLRSAVQAALHEQIEELAKDWRAVASKH